jgi:hypothetical protein
MRKYLQIICISAALLIAPLSAAAQSVFDVDQGGTGTSTPYRFLYGNGTSITSVRAGSGLTISGNALQLDASGNWTGTFDGQEGTYYLDLANHTGTLAINKGGTGSSTPLWFLFGTGSGLVSTSTIAERYLDSLIARDSELHAAVTLAGENYLSLSGQQITANAVNLGGTNVTGTLTVGKGGTGATSLSDILGTSNQITVSGGTARVIGGNVTLSLPQNIHTSANPLFNTLTASGLSVSGTSTLGAATSTSLGITGRIYQNNTATSVFTGGIFANDLRINLTNCDSLDTNGSGAIVCGSDASGAGGSISPFDWETIDGSVYGAPTSTLPIYVKSTLGVGTTTRSGTNIQTTASHASTAGLTVIGDDADADILDTYVNNESNERFSIRANGTLEWGDGISGMDTALRRSTANVLRTDDSFLVAGANLTIQGILSCNEALETDGSGNVVCGTDATGAGGGAFPFTSETWGNATTTTLGFLNGFVSSGASSSISDTLYLAGSLNASSTAHFGDAVIMRSDTTANALELDQNGNVGTAVSTDGAIHFINTDNTGIGLGGYTNIDATMAGPLVKFHSDNTAADQKIVELIQDGTDAGLYIEMNGTPVNAFDPGIFIKTTHSSSVGGALYFEDVSAARTISVDKNNIGNVLFFDQDVTNANNPNNALDLTHTSVVNDAATYTKTGVVVSFTSDVIESSGSITDSKKVLTVTQSHADSTGNVFEVINSSTAAKSLVVDTDALVVTAGNFTGIASSSPALPFSLTGDGYIHGGLGIGNATTTDGVLETSGLAYIGGTLKVKGSATSTIATGLDVQGGTIKIPHANCDTLDTDGSGFIKCGSDATGAGGTFPFSSETWGNATSTTLGFLNGFLSSGASSTISDILYLGNKVFASSTLSITGQVLATGDASEALPAYSFLANKDTGFNLNGSTLQLIVDENVELSVTNTTVSIPANQLSIAQTGDAGAPAFTIGGQTTGMFVNGTTLGVGVAGVERLSLTSHGQVGVASTSIPGNAYGFGVGTSTLITGSLGVDSPGTTTIFMNTPAALKGSCIQMKDASNGNMYRMYFHNGTLITQTGTCE